MENDVKADGIVLWNISKFKQLGVRKLSFWHSLVYFPVALFGWFFLSLVIIAPRMIDTAELSDNFGFKLIMYIYILLLIKTVVSSFSIIKGSNIPRWFIVWLGCWAISAVKIILFVILPGFFVLKLMIKLNPYNAEEIVLIFLGVCISGVFLFKLRMNSIFKLEDNDVIEQKEEVNKGGGNED